ncbi:MULTISPECIES: DUF6412 domain-containing protein [unclassified Streptomyces]|uniref:DUF6412 domain-containing protein n=1 Tax=unclassified Streptomyces TaxID=2593676 RepID=UPI0033A47B68
MRRLVAWVSVLCGLTGVLYLLFAGGGAFSVAAALVAVGSALVTYAVVAARSVAAVPPTHIRTALRDREQRTAFLPQRDPDAPGRRRPRAPGSRLVATAA